MQGLFLVWAQRMRDDTTLWCHLLLSETIPWSLNICVNTDTVRFHMDYFLISVSKAIDWSHLNLPMLKLEYFRITRLMTWQWKEPGDQQSWYLRINTSPRNNFKHLLQLCSCSLHSYPFWPQCNFVRCWWNQLFNTFPHYICYIWNDLILQ